MSRSKLKVSELGAAFFYTNEFARDYEAYNEVCELYDIIDVLGDGNCGPYVCLFGLINKLPKTESNELLCKLKTIKSGQSEVVQIRRRVHGVFTEQFVNSNKSSEYFSMLLGVEENYHDDLKAIFCENFDYFPDTLISDEFLSDKSYFPFPLAMLGFSILESLRVVVIQCDEKYDEDKSINRRRYSTTVIDSRQSDGIGCYNGKIMHCNEIYKIPDDDFQPSDTVELMFLNRDGCGHYMFLQRNRQMKTKELQKFRDLKLVTCYDPRRSETEGANLICQAQYADNGSEKKRKAMQYLETETPSSESNVETLRTPLDTSKDDLLDSSDDDSNNSEKKRKAITETATPSSSNIETLLRQIATRAAKTKSSRAPPEKKRKAITEIATPKETESKIFQIATRAVKTKASRAANLEPPAAVTVIDLLTSSDED